MSPRLPERFPVRVVDHDETVPAEDVRTWGQRNATALGTIIGTAMSVFLVGTGGLTGLAHVAGIALSKDLAPIKADIATIVKAQQDAPTATTIVEALKKSRDADAKKLDALARDVKALRADIARRSKRKPEPTESAGGTE